MWLGTALRGEEDEVRLMVEPDDVESKVDTEADERESAARAESGRVASLCPVCEDRADMGLEKLRADIDESESVNPLRFDDFSLH